MQEDFSLSIDAQNELLSLVRRRIAAEINGEKWSYAPPEELPELKIEAPAFVTLTKGGHLRGCIGYTSPQGQLWSAVEEMAFSAAFEDPRFNPVTKSELQELHIEVSVLSKMIPSSPEEIIPFKHGVLVRKGYSSGLFLPQVWEQLPDKEQFMAYLCMEKAGLPAEAWKLPGTKLFTFTVFAFEEHSR